MKIVVIGGTGQVGAKVVADLRASGHDALAAAPGTGVDVFTGAGLQDVLDGAEVVVDVTNIITPERAAAVAFFETAARNVARAEAAAGVRHHVTLGIARSEDLTESGYVAGKLAGEAIVKASGIPHSIVRATQFFELMPPLVDFATVDGVAKISGARFQPIAAADVAAVLTAVALGPPRPAPIEIGGPEIFHMDTLAARYAVLTGAAVRIERDPAGTYFGAPLADDTLLPDAAARRGAMTFEQWMAGRQ